MDVTLAKLRATWENVRAKLWFTPTVLVIFAVILSYFLLYLDRQYSAYLSSNLSWLFGGAPSATRNVLSTIAGSVITTISIAFSLTIIALQQASAQFTPRVMRNFTSDRGNQIVLGAFVATFVYSLLILKAVRDPAEVGGVGFAPPIATTAAIMFALICIGLLIYFISHTATSLQTNTILEKIHRELLNQINKLYPSRIGSGVDSSKKKRISAPSKSKEFITIKSDFAGFVLYISDGVLEKLSLKKNNQLHILPRIGDFIMQGQALAKLYGYKRLDKKNRNLIRSAVTVDGQRSLLQDPLFAIRQLVDIGIKAMSPGINDPTTATYCIWYLGDGLTQLLQREFPSQVRELKDSKMLLVLNRPTWDDFVTQSFAQIQTEARENIVVTHALLDVLSELAQQIPDRPHAKPLERLLKNARHYLRESSASTADRKDIDKRLKDIKHQLGQTNP